MINDPKEREYWTSKPRCSTCRLCQLMEREKYSGYDGWCTKKKKKVDRQNKYCGSDCGSYQPIYTPEQNKEQYLTFQRWLGLPSKRERGRQYQELCKQKKKGEAE